MSWTDWQRELVSEIFNITGSATMALSGHDYYEGKITKKEFINNVKKLISDADNFQLISVINYIDKKLADEKEIRRWYAQCQ